MDNSINLSVTPVQAILALAFQVWMIVFPILLIRKINYLTDLLHEHLDEHPKRYPQRLKFKFPSFTRTRIAWCLINRQGFW